MSFIRKRLTFANVAMTLALVFAMTGGAYAAGKYLITSTKQISPKVLKSLVGKAGPAGPAGSAGPAGPAGQAGEKGATGAAGGTGPQGAEGKEGKEGKEGPEGPQGEPWSAGGTLPPGKTETGEFVVTSPEGTAGHTALSYALPLPTAMKYKDAHYIKEPISGGAIQGGYEFPEDPKGCTGNVFEPGAEKGNLCVFAGEESNNAAKFGTASLPLFCAEEKPGACGALSLELSKYGFGLTFLPEGGELFVSGTWAVTAE